MCAPNFDRLLSVGVRTERGHALIALSTSAVLSDSGFDRLPALCERRCVHVVGFWRKDGEIGKWGFRSCLCVRSIPWKSFTALSDARFLTQRGSVE